MRYKKSKAVLVAAVVGVFGVIAATGVGAQTGGAKSAQAEAPRFGAGAAKQAAKGDGGFGKSGALKMDTMKAGASKSPEAHKAGAAIKAEGRSGAAIKGEGRSAAAIKGEGRSGAAIKAEGVSGAAKMNTGALKGAQKAAK